MPDITIDRDTLDEIMVATGFPVITMDDLEMTELDIRRLLIWPALRTFFRWFPLRVENQYDLNIADYSFDFPRPETYGVLDARLTTARTRAGAITANPFINAQNVSITQKYQGVYGTPYNYDMTLTRQFEVIERQSIIDMRKAFRVHVDNQNRKIYGYSNINGKFSVAWADYGTDFSQVPFDKLDDVINLAASHILRAFGRLRGQQNSDTPNSFNYTEFIDEADRLRDEVLDKWRSYTKPVLLRG